MVDRLTPPSRGALDRHKTLASRVEGLRGMAWAYAVLSSTGLSASAASKKYVGKLAIDGQGNPVRSNLFYKYLSGSHAPKAGPRGKHRFDLVSRIAADPRSAPANQWLEHDLFKVFQSDANLDELCRRADQASDAIRIAMATTTKDEPSQRIVGVDGKLLELTKFDDFVAVCSWLRATDLTGQYQPGVARLLSHLYPGAVKLEPVFAYIQAPFRKMLDDFFVPPTWKRDEDWSNA